MESSEGGAGMVMVALVTVGGVAQGRKRVANVMGKSSCIPIYGDDDARMMMRQDDDVNV